jgi:predicted ferric reductase
VIATSSQLLWYATRSTGIVAFVLLTAVVVLGVLTTVRAETVRWPRFAVQDLHRRISLLTMVFIGAHVLTTVTDAYAPIGWVSIVVPFSSPYRRFWLGLGTAAVDLLLAVIISSLLRGAISHRMWRALHWLAYAAWPLALVHAVGTGTDHRLGWAQLLGVACMAAVLGAVAVRLVIGRSDRRAVPAAADPRLGGGPLDRPPASDRRVEGSRR